MSHFARLIAFAMLIGVLAGLASAAFLVALTAVTTIFTTQPWLLYLLPVIGAVIAWIYQRYGGEANAGNNLILEHIHSAPHAVVPFRMFPLILGSTLLTHLAGGSAGREGTAVQIGGSIAATLARLLRSDARETRLVLLAGMSAGFGGVFGTPLAGTLFAMEVLAVGGVRYLALVPCLVAAFVSDWTVRALGVPHTHFSIATMPDITLLVVSKILIAAGLFALVSLVFSEGVHRVNELSKRFFPNVVVRAVVGGLLVIVLTLSFGTTAYNGLSLPLMQAAFTPTSVPAWAFACKLLLTVVTIGFGYKGGEVTPLFVIGATLGAAIAPLLGLPHDMLAALGLIAVFAAAANTPLTCILMGVELFGAAPLHLFAICTIVTYTLTGHRGIYLAQRVMTHKYDHDVDTNANIRLRDVRKPDAWWN